MIIKSMSRKEPSFGQLIEYMSDIEKSENQYNIHQNIYARKIKGIEKEFLENSKFITKRKNGVYLYHEILSITKAKNLDIKKQKEALRELAYEYAKNRADQNLIFGTLHDDHDEHLHYHLIISANAVGEAKKTRLSKVEFSNFKKDMENQVLQKYPELEQKVVINHKPKEKLSNKAYETKRRTGTKLIRDLLKEKLQYIFSQSTSKETLFNDLTKEKLELYVRGKTLGIVDTQTGRKYRLKTLGLLPEFEELSKRIRLDGQQFKKAKNKNKEQAKKTTAKSNAHTNKTPQIFEEWVLGDFTKRDQISRVKARESNKEGLYSKPDKLTRSEQVKEWLSGNFTKRDKRIKQASYKNLVEALNSENKSLTKLDKIKEWVAGDFSARNEKVKFDHIIARKKEEKTAKLKKEAEEKAKKQKQKSQKEKSKIKRAEDLLNKTRNNQKAKMKKKH